MMALVKFDLLYDSNFCALNLSIDTIIERMAIGLDWDG